MKTPPKPPTIAREARLLFVIMVVVGYIVTFVINASNGRVLTPFELFGGIALGVIYLFFGLGFIKIFDRLPPGWAEGTFFSVQLILVFGIGLLMGTGGNWLVGLPLAGFVVEGLKPRWRVMVYLLLIAALVLPIGLRQGSWKATLINSATIGTGVFFVAVFAQMRLNEQHARERAERLMLELEGANAQLAAYATQAEELAMTQERNRLAREIHDNLGHYLTVVNVQIEAARVVMESDPARTLDALDKAQELTQKGLTRVRESVAALRESPVSNRPLSEAIASLVRETQNTGLVTEFKIIGEPITLRNKVALALYRAAQEGLTNVRRHARASRVDVLLDFQPDQVLLEVADNGVGAAETGGGFGLLGIRERMQLLGGSLEVDTSVGKGFRLRASVPVSSPAEAELLES